MEEILVVDDSKLNQAVLTRILGGEYKIVCANSGKEMFTLLEKINPKLILLDIIMPDLDGFEVIAKLKVSEEYSKIPVIFITGLDDPDSEEKGFQLGAIDYITKPFKENVIKARVNSYVKLYDFVRQAEVLGQRDGLTGLYNKKMTEQQIKKLLSSEPPLTNGALMIVDIDNFKSINDSFGHLYGDMVIKQLGNSLRGIFQKSDILGRVGGDEFFVFLRNYKEIDIIKARAEDVCNAFRKTYEQNGITINISASIGIATTSDSLVFEEIYKYADIALYSTKVAGKNNYTFYEGQKDVVYKSNRTNILNSQASKDDLGERIRDFSENLKEYVFNLVEETKDAEYTIQYVLRMIAEQFSFFRAYITKLDYTKNGIKCIDSWINFDPQVQPTVKDLSIGLVAKMSETFKSHNLFIAKGNDDLLDLGFGSDKDSDTYIFALRNKKILLGYIVFEKYVNNEEQSDKEIGYIIDVCQQLSTVIVNQFLIETAIKDKESMSKLLDSLDTAVMVVKIDGGRPLYLNKAAKEMGDNIYNAPCFEKGNKKGVVLKLIAEVPAYKEKKFSCQKINWIDGSDALMLQIREI